PQHHVNTQIIDLLNSNWLHSIAHSDPNTYTWSNSTGTCRTLDHIFMSEEFLTVKCHTEITDVSQYFDTDHRAIINSVHILHILNLNRNALRKTRRKKNHTEEILDNRHNIQTHWLLFKETLEENFKCPFEESPQCSTNMAYGRIIDQVRSSAKVSLRWKETGSSNSYKFSCTETKIQKGRKFFRKYKHQFLNGEPLTKQIESLKLLYQFLPEIPWFNTHPINSQEFYIEVKETWQR